MSEDKKFVNEADLISKHVATYLAKEHKSLKQIQWVIFGEEGSAWKNTTSSKMSYHLLALR